MSFVKRRTKGWKRDADSWKNRSCERCLRFVREKEGDADDMDMNVFWGIFIPFAGTSAGAASVFFMKKSMNEKVQRALTGFASGVMTAASVWSLLIPALEQAKPMGKLSFVPAAIGFWVGVLFLLLLDHVIPHLHRFSDKAEGPVSHLQKTTMLVLAVTLHNIPEGMAVGVVYAGYLTGNGLITAAAAMALSLGIAIQNFPEGAIISMPLRGRKQTQGFHRRRPFRYRRADRSGGHDSRGIRCRPHSAVSAQFCGGSHAVCRR